MRQGVLRGGRPSDNVPAIIWGWVCTKNAFLSLSHLDLLEGACFVVVPVALADKEAQPSTSTSSGTSKCGHLLLMCELGWKKLETKAVATHQHLTFNRHPPPHAQ
jgi:hypothetical protein